jgi:hypothetical protein
MRRVGRDGGGWREKSRRVGLVYMDLNKQNPE